MSNLVLQRTKITTIFFFQIYKIKIFEFLEIKAQYLH